LGWLALALPIHGKAGWLNKLFFQDKQAEFK